jgi:GcrA cell cycle regulator
MTYEAPSAQPDQPHECYSDRSEGAAPRPETALNDAGSIWTDTLQAQLRELWEQGLTASQIAAELSVTRNAVIGKAHRLGLSGRASPIQRSKAPKLTLVALKERMCRWPIGHPGDPDFYFCGGEVRPNSSYCPEHHVRAYMPFKKKMSL